MPAPDLATLGLVLDDNGFVRGIDKTTGALKKNQKAGAQVEQQTNKIGGAAKLARPLLLSFGVALGGLQLALLAKQARDFNSAIAEVSTLLPPGVKASEELVDATRQLSINYAQAPVEQARALYQVISAGASDAASAIGILETANRLAVGGVTDVATAADGLTSLLNAYGLTAREAEGVSDSLFTAMRAGKTTIDELSRTLGRVAPLASSTNVSIDEMTAAVAALTKGGISTKESVTGLRAILAAVAKPTQEAVDESRRLGIQFNVTALEAQGLRGFLETIVTATDGSTDSMAQLFGGVEALVPVLALAGKAGEDFEAILDDMENKAGATGEAFRKVAESDADRYAVAMAQIKDLTLQLGEVILSAVVPPLELIAKGIRIVSEEDSKWLRIQKELNAQLKLTGDELGEYRELVDGLSESQREAYRTGLELQLQRTEAEREQLQAEADAIGSRRTRLSRPEAERLDEIAARLDRLGALGTRLGDELSVVHGSIEQAAEEAAEALETQTAAMNEAAEKAAEYNRTASEAIQIRLLEAQGLKEQAIDLQHEIELRDAIARGLDEQGQAALRHAQSLEKYQELYGELNKDLRTAAGTIPKVTQLESQQGELRRRQREEAERYITTQEEQNRAMAEGARTATEYTLAAANLANALGLVGDDGARAATALASIGGGAARLYAGDLSAIPQLLGGLAGLVGLGGNDEASRRREAAEEERRRVLESNTEAIDRLRESIHGVQELTDAQLQEIIGFASARSDQLSRGPLASSLSLDALQARAGITPGGDPEFFDRLRKEAERLGIELDGTAESWKRFTEALELGRERLAEYKAVFLDNLEIRRLSAEGLSEEAEILRERIQHEKEIRDARLRGLDEETIAVLESVQAAEKRASAARREARALEEAEDFDRDVRALELAAGGASDDEIRRFYDRERILEDAEDFRKRAEEALKSGRISQARFDEIVELIDTRTAKALEDLGDSAEDTANAFDKLSTDIPRIFGLAAAENQFGLGAGLLPGVAPQQQGTSAFDSVDAATGSVTRTFGASPAVVIPSGVSRSPAASPAKQQVTTIEFSGDIHITAREGEDIEEFLERLLAAAREKRIRGGVVQLDSDTI